jgi:hypothetical protein
VRLLVRQTSKGSPAIAEREDYNNSTGGLPHDQSGKVLSRKR